MLILKNFVLLSLIILIGSCTTKNFDKVQNIANYSIEVDTPNDKYNIYLKENLRRLFYVNDKKAKYIIKTKIAFETTKTLSVRGQSILKSTKARVDYQLINKVTNIVVKSGSIKTFPASSSSSSSLYTQEKSINHIKERLTMISAKSLYTRINVIIRRLS